MSKYSMMPEWHHSDFLRTLYPLPESTKKKLLHTCHEKECSGLISLQLDSLIWKAVGPRTNKLKIVNESLPDAGIIVFYFDLFIEVQYIFSPIIES